MTVNRHIEEVERNREVWQRKPLLRRVYADFYTEIRKRIDRRLPGPVLELGSGVGGLKEHFDQVIATDLFLNPWLDLTCDAYRLPLRSASLSHIVIFDVFHHLARPQAMLIEAKRVLVPSGRLILFEPFLSLISWIVYGLFHSEAVAWNAPIDGAIDPPGSDTYYAAQGNATRLFFRQRTALPEGLELLEAHAISSLGYFLTGGFSKPALIPEASAGLLQRIDRALSRWPRLFGGRCIVTLIRR